MPPPSGALLIDKPIGESSRTTLDALERTLKIGPLGHTGTLDPLATGLLIVLVGTARRLQELMLGSTKVYDAEFTFGATSETLDGEGPNTTTGEPEPALEQALPPAIASFIGDLQQIPPAHSAVHVDGKRAYSLARMGTDPKLKPRRVRVDAIDVVAAAATTARLRVTCGPGTYIRSLARDIGQTLG
ncbi:MAG: tRNA pseudouridine(55) synthase TruB, partial [Planctomycetota bacterium]|nr:tRNA pseudouridine(55) synthase TruB [Planctomycetota bacterium]